MNPTAAEKRRMNRVAQLPCLACLVDMMNGEIDYPRGPSKIHHCRHNCGMSQRKHSEIAPLCQYHHQDSNESRHNRPKVFADKYGTDLELHERTCVLLGEVSFCERHAPGPLVASRGH